LATALAADVRASDPGFGRCHADGPKRGTIVYLHGVADNRTSIRGGSAFLCS
jgi:hypothetical protein